MNTLTIAYKLGESAALEKIASMALIRTVGGRALGHLAKSAPKQFGAGTFGNKALRTIGRNTVGDGAFMLGGAMNAYNTEGSLGDKALAFGIGGTSWGVGWRGASRASNLMAGRFGAFKPGSGLAYAKKLQSLGVSRGQAARAARLRSQANSALRKGDYTKFQDLTKAQKEITGQLGMLNKARLALSQNKKGLALAGTAYMGADFLTTKGSDLASNMVGIGPQQQAEKDRIAQYSYQPQLPYRASTLGYQNNPYS